MILGILVWGLGLILSSEKPNHWIWIEIGTPIFMLYFVITFTIYCIAEWDNLTKPIDGITNSDQIYVIPTYVY